MKSQREYCEISQSELAKKVGISQGYIFKMETCGWVPSYRIIDTIAKVLDTNTDYLFNKKPVEPKKEEKIDISSIKNLENFGEVDEMPDIEKLNNLVLKQKILQDFAEESPKNDDIPDDPDCKKVLELVQKNLDHLFKITGDQFFVSPKTSLYSLSEIAKHYKISPSYLFEDHEKEWLKEEIENKYKEIEQMEAKLATLEKND